ncbi:MAG: dihydroorotate dehydrogenase 2 [Dehalococcoidia bacterium]|nr:dihydroorotate dehydrogenase 2 [Dehalococcoidia bacterium]
MALALFPKTYESLLRPLLFTLPPEKAQKVADRTLKLWPLWRALTQVGGFTSPRIETSVGELALRNPVGLAAGYDKSCELLPGLAALGFGYVTCGTVTLEPRPGNPGARLLRDESRHALLNALGFPGQGLDAAVERISAGRRLVGDTPVVVSISGSDIEDIATCHRTLEPLADAIEVNISSPNTANLRVFHYPDILGELLDELNESRTRPLFVKLPPFPRHQDDPKHHDLVLSLADVCASKYVDALTVANTQPVQDERLGVGSGGLSGRPIFGQMLRMVHEVRERTGNHTAINASGGIFTAWDAWQALMAGADSVQVMTGFVYRGPGIARDISAGLDRMVQLQELNSIHSVGPWASAS